MDSLWTFAFSCLAMLFSAVAISYSFKARMYAADAARYAQEAADMADVALRTHGIPRDPEHLRRIISDDEVTSPWTLPAG